LQPLAEESTAPPPPTPNALISPVDATFSASSRFILCILQLPLICTLLYYVLLLVHDALISPSHTSSCLDPTPRSPLHTPHGSSQCGRSIKGRIVARLTIAFTVPVIRLTISIAAPVAHETTLIRACPASKTRPPLAPSRIYGVLDLSPSSCSLRRGVSDVQELHAPGARVRWHTGSDDL
jgi:hypothetical protein